MNITPDEAQNTLREIKDSIQRTRRSISALGTGEILILWGCIWISGYLLTHFSLSHPERIGLIWGILDLIGFTGTIIIVFWFYKRGYTRSIKDKSIGRKIFLFWLLLFVYLFIWQQLLSPHQINGIQLNVFLVTGVMFAFIVTGFWLEVNYLAWLGLAVTALGLIGYYIIPPAMFNLWMAPTCGGALLGTGVYIRCSWR